MEKTGRAVDTCRTLAGKIHLADAINRRLEDLCRHLEAICGGRKLLLSGEELLPNSAERPLFSDDHILCRESTLRNAGRLNEKTEI